MRNIVSLLLLMSLPLSLFALPSDKALPVQFTADNAQFDHKHGYGEYWGHISLTQGTTHLSAAKVRSYSQKGHLVKVMAFGNDRSAAHFQTIPEEKKPLLVAQADQITYDISARTVDLHGHAHITQQGDSISAPDIHIDLKNQKIRSSGSTNHAVTIHYQPKQNPHEHT